MIDTNAAGGVADEHDATLNQVSVYLLRDEIGDFTEALRDSSLPALALEEGLGIAGALYIARATSREPQWLPFVRGIVAGDIPYQAPTRLSGVLFLERGGNRFALTFGYGRHLLRREAIVADFGLKVAAGLVDADDLASIDARSMETPGIQIRRQSSRGVDTRSMGVNVGREMVRAIAGRMDDPALGKRVVGSDSVGVAQQLDITGLGPYLDLLHGTYASRAYAAHFKHIDRWTPVGPGPDLTRLDDQLRGVLINRRRLLLAGEDPDARPGPERAPRLEAPEVIEWRASGFRTSPEPRTALHSFPDLDNYLASVGREPTDNDLRRNHSQQLISDEANDVIATWSIYEALNWEAELNGRTYVLAEGSWWAIDADYLARVDQVVADILPADLPRPPFDPVVEHEPDYNKRLQTYQPGRALLDRTVARFEDENGTVEPCDVFTSSLQFVHVKRDESSAMLSHLFAQAAVSARLFLMFSPFRDELRKLLAATPDLAAKIPPGSPTSSDYEVVLGIISPRPAPVALQLPFFARNHLAQIVPDIESMGFKVRIAHIDHQPGSRPADAGPLFRDEAAEKVKMRSTRHSRRRAPAAPLPTPAA